MTRLALAIAGLVSFQQAAFRSGVDLVQVDVSVMRGRTPVAGLTIDNFTLTDNGVPQDVKSATLDRLPISVTLVLDTSGSVAGDELAHLIDAGQQLVRSLRPGDRAGLITFAERVVVNIPLTLDHDAVVRALGTMKGRGATSLNDAIHIAMNLGPNDTSRSVIMVFTDGADNMSWAPPASLVDEAKKTPAVIHAIELQKEDVVSVHQKSAALEAQQFLNGVPLLRELTLQSGGRIWSAKSSRDLRTLFTQALDEMRARYLLTYTPKGAPQEGWHTVKVALKNVRGEVTARPGYFVGAKEQKRSTS